VVEEVTAAVMPVVVIRATVAAKGVAQATRTTEVVEVAGEVAGTAVELVKAGEVAEITATVIGVVGIALAVLEAPAAVRAMEMAEVKAVRALEAAAVVRVLGTVAVPAQAMEVAAGEMGEPAVAPAKDLRPAALEVAARAVAALEEAIIRAPGPVAVPARAMQAEAVLVPEKSGALEK
jgi:hypothetical protein